MRVTLKDLMDKLGVGRVMAPYETQPWFVHDAEKAIMCSAEVRMGPGSEDVEAEIQFLKDESEDTPGGPEQIMRMRVLPVTTGEWSTKELIVKGKDYNNLIDNWEEKGCNFFRAFIEALQMGEIPNVDELIEKELPDDDLFGGGGRGRIGRKSPKIKPGALLGMKKGM